MTDWDGKGLPPAAQARIERAQADGVRTSFLSVPGHFGVEAAGFYPIGEVMGCVVAHLGWQGYGGCGIYNTYGYNTYSSGFAVSFDAYRPYENALREGWANAIRRMLEECRGLGGDGIVGIRLETSHFEGGNREFLAIGTAVRAKGDSHLHRPFSTGLSGVDLLKLTSRGYMPASLIVAIAVGVRHDDYYTRASAQAFAPNVEVPGYSELVHEVRSASRRDLESQVRALGADGAVLTSPMRLSIHELEVGENHRDHAAEASLVATAVVKFSEGDHPVPASVLSMR